MNLGELFEGLPGGELGANAGLEATSLAYDSRRAQPGTLFFAIQGAHSDGHDFIAAAMERGAVGVVSERVAPAGPAGLASRWVRVPVIRRALSRASRAFYGHPEDRLRLVGITGTNGKTTTAYLLESIFRAAGMPAGVFGTIEYRVAGRVKPAVNTTPESLDLARDLAEITEAGGKVAVMEVSSHALTQERVWGFRFWAAVFTNLTRDHLDYHKDFESYFEAKRRLFVGLGTPPPELAVVNLDDPWGARLAALPYHRLITYGIKSDAQVKVKHFTQSAAGLSATVLSPEGSAEIHSPLLGRANLENVLAATATALGMGIPAEQIQQGIAELPLVPGRFERVDEGQPFLVVVDYAHTDDALRNVLTAARELTQNRLIVVFGCGGDRDRAKRPLMGEAASAGSDLAVLTSDNPRSENPIDIMNDALVGVQKTGKPHLIEIERGAAIRKALEEAREGDVVVIAGKGHETYQVLKDGRVPFDDREVARNILNEMGFRKAENKTAGDRG
ncbi:MAG TPA: UDP-N-acetylmuramoyl-L-alanyl-D-glutamate--2,6-diaminopimelate ligase [Terriglobia bacterium]|nr:UDP-N-acetylmuramoyl-L-alanyl-D-glutamate--2,6-diaminopimelate ligase [Terriglobia bacterium]